MISVGELTNLLHIEIKQFINQEKKPIFYGTHRTQSVIFKRVKITSVSCRFYSKLYERYTNDNQDGKNKLHFQPEKCNLLSVIQKALKFRSNLATFSIIITSSNYFGLYIRKLVNNIMKRLASSVNTLTSVGSPLRNKHINDQLSHHMSMHVQTETTTMKAKLI